MPYHTGLGGHWRSGTAQETSHRNIVMDIILNSMPIVQRFSNVVLTNKQKYSCFLLLITFYSTGFFISLPIIVTEKFCHFCNSLLQKSENHPESAHHKTTAIFLYFLHVSYIISGWAPIKTTFKLLPKAKLKRFTTTYYWYPGVLLLKLAR